MLSLKLCQAIKVPCLQTSASKFLGLSRGGTPQVSLVRLYADNTGQSAWRTARQRRRTFAETINKPAGETAFNIGKGAVAGGAALGIGALCYYGLGLSNEAGAVERSRLWPEYVKERVRDTYMYFGASILLTAGSAVAVIRSPIMLKMMAKNSWMAVGATMLAMMGTGIVTQMIPYSPGFGAKQAAWMLHTSVIGAVLAPLCLMGGPVIVKALWYTGGIVGALSAIAACAPNEKFLNTGGPLAMGLGAVFVASLGSMFFPVGSALGAGLYSVSLYGGLLVFSGLMLYDTQRIIHNAENHPLYAERPFDPVNASISIYLDAVNIFVRLMVILSGGGGNKKR